MHSADGPTFPTAAEFAKAAEWNSAIQRSAAKPQPKSSSSSFSSFVLEFPNFDYEGEDDDEEEEIRAARDEFDRY